MKDLWSLHQSQWSNWASPQVCGVAMECLEVISAFICQSSQGLNSATTLRRRSALQLKWIWGQRSYDQRARSRAYRRWIQDCCPLQVLIVMMYAAQFDTSVCLPFCSDNAPSSHDNIPMGQHSYGICCWVSIIMMQYTKQWSCSFYFT